MTIVNIAELQSSIPLIEIVIDSDAVSPVLADYDDADKQFTVVVLTEIIVEGDFPVPDQMFRVPFRRVDTGRVVPMAAKVVDGKFSLRCVFPTEGEWEVTTDLINSKLPEPMFQVATHTFFVMSA